jgi:hypothetical protein
VTGARASNVFDGTYSGTQYAVNPDYCGYTERPSNFVIRDDHFSVRLGQGRKDVDVASDGTFWATNIAGDKPRWMATFHGKITDGQLVADIDSGHCALHITAAKVQ